MNETVLQTEISNYDLNTNELKQLLKQELKVVESTKYTNHQKMDKDIMRDFNDQFN